MADLGIWGDSIYSKKGRGALSQDEVGGLLYIFALSQPPPCLPVKFHSSQTWGNAPESKKGHFFGVGGVKKKKKRGRKEKEKRKKRGRKEEEMREK